MRRCQKLRATYKNHILRGQAVRCVLFRLGVWQIWTPRHPTDHHAGSVYCLLDWKFLSELRHVCRPESSPWNLQRRWDKRSRTAEMTRECTIFHQRSHIALVTSRYFVLLVFSVTPFKIDQHKKSKPFNRLSPESGNRKKVHMQRLSPRFRSQQFFSRKICEETFSPNL